MQASNGQRKEATMSAMSELSDYIDAQRERLHKALSQVMVYNHGACDIDVDTLIEDEFEAALKRVDTYAAQLGVPWHVALASLVRSFEAQVAWIIKEIEGEE